MDTLREVLGWCCVINMAMLVIWLVGILTARDAIHRLHGRWFRLSDAQFDTIHYAGMAFYKIAIFLFNLVPWIALHIVG